MLLKALEICDPVFVSPRFDDGDALFESTREQLENALGAIAAGASPFSDRRPHPGDTDVEPVMSVDVRYLEVTSSGVLRQARFRQLGGRRTDCGSRGGRQT
jgi:hypothetical protein